MHLLVEDGEIRGSESIVAPARLRNEPRELAQTEAPGPLEHHVLEHVRDAGRAGPLIHAARSIPYLMNDGGRPVVFLHDQAQAVRQGELVRVRLRARNEREGKKGGACGNHCGE